MADPFKHYLQRCGWKPVEDHRLNEAEGPAVGSMLWRMAGDEKS